MRQAVRTPTNRLRKSEERKMCHASLVDRRVSQEHGAAALNAAAPVRYDVGFAIVHLTHHTKAGDLTTTSGTPAADERDAKHPTARDVPLVGTRRVAPGKLARIRVKK